MVILTGVRQYLIVVLICICLMVSEAEQLVYQLAICMSSFEKYLFKFFVNLKTRLFVFLLLSCPVSNIFWILNSYQIYVSKRFSPILQVFSSLCCLLAVMKLISLIQSCQFIFAACALRVKAKKSLPRPISRNFFLIFSFSHFTVAGLTVQFFSTF